MLNNYLKIAARNLWRHKGYTAINVFGLAVAMAACLLIGLYVEDELSYDTFHEAADRIMVVGLESDFFGSTQNTPYPLASIAASDVPGVDAVVRTRGDADERTVRNEAASFQRRQYVLETDSTFFRVFSFEFVRGNPATALDGPNRAVIAESMARTFFGAADPIGRSLTVKLRGAPREVTVAGVVRDVPSNSTIQFDMIVPITLAPPSEGQLSSWGTLMFHTYARLDQHQDEAAFTEQLQRAVQPHIEDFSFRFAVLPLSGLYLSDFYTADGFSGEHRYIYLFSLIVLLILGIAAINYVNLVTAQASQRAGEVGVRKTMGAHRRQIALQFLGESALLSTVALLLSVGVLMAVLPAFNGVFGKELTLQATRHVQALAGLSGFVLLVSIAAGAYPAFVLSSFQPVRVLRGASGTTVGRGGWLRKGLVVAQFAASAALILGTVVVYQQLHYVQNKSLGFAGERVVTVDLSVSEERQPAVKQEVLGHPDVRRATIGDAMPGGFNVSFSMEVQEISSAAQTDRENIMLRPAQVDADYVETLGLNLLAGRSFSADRTTDRTQAYILNEAAVNAMGWTVEGAVGKPFTFAREESVPIGEVIGVVENFHIESLHSEIEPVVLQMEATRFASSGGILAAKLAPEGVRAAMDHIEQVMTAAVPDETFQYTFLDERFDAMYRSERRLAQIFTVFAGIAILIACMGLFGLAAFAAERRTKEIGIRKALGASVTNVIALLSREFAVLVVVALVLGTPAAYWAMNRWLDDFAYRITIGPGLFVLTATVALCIAGVSVGYHALRAARTDPATALRYE